MLKPLWNWFVRSSADPKKVSLSVKGILLGIIPVLSITGLDTSSLPQGVDFVIGALEQTLIIISASITFVGFVRKLKNTFF